MNVFQLGVGVVNFSEHKILLSTFTSLMHREYTTTVVLQKSAHGQSTLTHMQPLESA